MKISQSNEPDGTFNDARLINIESLLHCVAHPFVACVVIIRPQKYETLLSYLILSDPI